MRATYIRCSGERKGKERERGREEFHFMYQWFRTSFRANHARISQPFLPARGPARGKPGAPLCQKRPELGSGGLCPHSRRPSFWRGTLTLGQASRGPTVRPPGGGFSPRTWAGLSTWVFPPERCCVSPSEDRSGSKVAQRNNSL